MKKQLETQVLIVGAGSTGLSIARELSKYKVDVTVVEKNIDVALGVVKSSLGLIFSSYGLANANSLIPKSSVTPDLSPSELFEPDTLKTRLGREGFDAFPALAEELDIEFRMFRELIIGRDEPDFRSLDLVEEICRGMNVRFERLDREGIQAYEPHISKDYTRGLTYYGDEGQIYPWEYSIALAENARDNGVRIMLLTEIKGITPLSGGFMVDTTSGAIKTKFIINAGGGYADKIAEMAEVRDFGLLFIGNQFHIIDKRFGGMVNTIVETAFRPGVAEMIKPTLSGNILLAGSGLVESKGLEDTATKAELMKQDLASMQRIFPGIPKGGIITSYYAVSAFNTRDPENHLLEVSRGNANFLNAVVRMPGMGFTPAMSRYMVELLANQGLELTTKADFNPYRKRIPRVSELSDEERKGVIAKDPRYGHIICRCEEVSEGEIVEAIKRGARSVVGVKYRTRAGMGRCQRGFCGPRVLEILARELDIPMTEVTMKGGLSRVLLYRSKELLNAGG